MLGRRTGEQPALAVDAQVALTLRALGGLTTAEVARASLVAEPTMEQRIVRAKRKIAAAGSRRACGPGELGRRVASLGTFGDVLVEGEAAGAEALALLGVGLSRGLVLR